MIKNGIVYITFVNDKEDVREINRINELVHSVNSVRSIHKDIDITLFTNTDIHINGINKIIKVPITKSRVKQDYLYDSPYKNTLYLDCDTSIVNPIDDVFSLMSRFDLAATQDIIRKDEAKSKLYPAYASIPSSFPEYGGGVIVFSKSKSVEMFFDVWRRNFEEWFKLTGEVRDQPSFRVSLWQCYNLKLHTLPPEFNIRSKKYHNIVPKIYHSHNMTESSIKGGNIWI